MRRTVRILACLLAALIAHAGEREAARVYESLRASPRLEPFLRAFPKGGDLHNHLGGSLTPEQWIAIAIRRSFCVDEKALVLIEAAEPGCPAGTAPAASL